MAMIWVTSFCLMMNKKIPRKSRLTVTFAAKCTGMSLKIGVLGCGHLGKIHLNCISQLSQVYELTGFYDPNETVAKTVEETLGYRRFNSIEALIDAVEVVDIVTPTLSHYDCAILALDKGKHIFVEKPLTNTLEEARDLISRAEKINIKAQVGHVERFNPAFLAAQPFIQNPMFIESHRLAEFNPRGTDVSVVMDLMIHDIDVLMSIVHAPIKNISASGVAVVSETADICNARIEFENGCVANLTASRISMKNMRKMRMFQKDAYITVDFLKKAADIVRMDNLPDDAEDNPYAMILELKDGKKKQIYFENPKIEPNNAILEELKSLAMAIRGNTPVTVTLQDGYEALEVAHRITENMQFAIHV
jgi:predicted dehydrogenase